MAGGVGIRFDDDILDMLRGLAAAGRDRHPEYHAALRDVAVSFGLGQKWVPSVPRLISVVEVPRLPAVVGQAGRSEP